MGTKPVVTGKWLDGQVTIEYFILFAVMAMLTIVGLTSFQGGIKTSFQGFVNAAAEKLAQ
ncbi:MAG: hypothetical protein HYZ89_00320 [Candidatus Omnitrophica bacterium]|nr:hypothetical protein [Candidatus Omnitrophota bacterium]